MVQYDSYELHRCAVATRDEITQHRHYPKKWWVKVEWRKAGLVWCEGERALLAFPIGEGFAYAIIKGSKSPSKDPPWRGACLFPHVKLEACVDWISVFKVVPFSNMEQGSRFSRAGEASGNWRFWFAIYTVLLKQINYCSCAAHTDVNLIAFEITYLILTHLRTTSCCC